MLVIGPEAGWTGYSPLANCIFSKSPGTDLCIMGLVLIGTASLTGAVLRQIAMYTRQEGGLTVSGDLALNLPPEVADRIVNFLGAQGFTGAEFDSGRVNSIAEMMINPMMGSGNVPARKGRDRAAITANPSASTAWPHHVHQWRPFATPRERPSASQAFASCQPTRDQVSNGGRSAAMRAPSTT